MKIQTPLIKSLLILFVGSLLVSCNPYRYKTFSNDALYEQRRKAGAWQKYVVLVHEPANDTTYKLVNTVFSNDTIYGTPKPLDAIDTVAYSNKTKKEVRKRMYLELNEGVTLINLRSDTTVELPKRQVNKVHMYAKKKRGALGIIGTVLLFIVALLLVLILILIAAIASADSSGATSSSSNTGGGGGGGNSSGSCYIATMVYGSYESPEVMELRRFRDQVLLRHKWGRAFVSWYYSNSPAFVARWKDSDLVNRFVRGMLTPLVWIVKNGLKK